MSAENVKDIAAPPAAPTAAEGAAPPAAPAAAGDVTVEEYFHPETGEKISKNAWKKIQKNGGKEKVKKGFGAIGVKANPDKEKKPEKKKKVEEIFVDNTPAGEKKLLDGVFPPTYQPKYVEAAWQTWWEKSGYYKPDVEKALDADYDDKFVMVIPPPNVTGSLHLGHALTNAVEDTLTRWHRMNGKVALWVPGTDHAGIATQSVVEKRLKKEENLSRHDLGRDEFIKRVWDWKETYGNKITGQIRSLGASCDWDREAFTMDSNLSTAVTEAFCKFHEDGLLYRDTRLVNWSCALRSAISEIEVDHLDLEGQTWLNIPGHDPKKKYEFGMITSFAYKVVDSDDELVVATTRLETMLGDTGVAVHPEDPRYKHLHGKLLHHPFVDRKIPILLDGELVDMNFGTGAVKVTPAHDPNDYNCGKRHGLDFIVVVAEDGTMGTNAGKYAGQMRYDVRQQMEKDLDALGLYRGKAVNKMRLGLCSRSGDVIEPMLTPQWYVNCTSMAKRATDAVRNGDLKIVPAIHEDTWYYWLDNIRDWCVSRQLWWGHRIPAYFARVEGEAMLDKNEPGNNQRWVVGRTEAAAREQAAEKLGVTEDQVVLEQDEDVLDTWFSSGLFPFSVFGWPNPTVDLKAFYPTSLLETGLDILFFWVARMVMMGLHLTDTLPFTQVYLHAMVRDKHGRKMSKSLGNVIDPLEVIHGCTLQDLLDKISQGNLPAKEIKASQEAQKKDFPTGIPECGADALRFGLLSYTVQGRDVNLDIQRVVGYRQFCNKMWNAVRFALAYVSDFTPSPTTAAGLLAMPGLSQRERFILHRLNATITECETNFKAYLFGNVTSALHSFFLYDVCDLYLELCKPVFQDATESGAEAKKAAQATLYTVLEQYLRLCHPIMPFVTEELWQRLPNLAALESTASIMIAPYPKIVPAWENARALADMEIIKSAINAARSVRFQYKVANSVETNFYFKTESAEVKDAIAGLQKDFCTLAKANFLKAASEDTPKGCSIKVVSDELTLLVDLRGAIDIDVEVARLAKDMERLLPLVDGLKRKMNDPAYERVPEKVRQTNDEKLSQYETELVNVQTAIGDFKSMQ